MCHIKEKKFPTILYLRGDGSSSISICQLRAGGAGGKTSLLTDFYIFTTDFSSYESSFEIIDQLSRKVSVSFDWRRCIWNKIFFLVQLNWDTPTYKNVNSAKAKGVFMLRSTLKMHHHRASQKYVVKVYASYMQVYTSKLDINGLTSCVVSAEGQEIQYIIAS